MGLTRATWGDIPLLVASGPLDRDTCGPLRSALNGLTEARHNIAFVDLSDVTSMDGAGLSALVAWVQDLHGRGWLGVIGANDDIRRLLADGGLVDHPNVRMFETRQAALVVTGERQST